MGSMPLKVLISDNASLSSTISFSRSSCAFTRSSNVSGPPEVTAPAVRMKCPPTFTARAPAANPRLHRALDRRVEDARLALVDVHRDTPERALGDAALEARPGLAAVGRLEEAAAGPAAVHAAGRPPALIHRRVHDLAVGRVHDDVVGPRAVVVVFTSLLGGVDDDAATHVRRLLCAPAVAGAKVTRSLLQGLQSCDFGGSMPPRAAS